MKPHFFALLAMAAIAGAFARAEEAPPPFSLADLAWLEGHWVIESGAGRAEEIWMAPLDGSMVGSFRWAGPGMHVLEFMVIEEKDGAVTFRFKHFDRNYRAWEAESPNAYQLAEVGDRSARFVNVDWNGRVPQVIRYERAADERLSFRGESPDGKDEPLVLEFRRAD